MLTSIFSMQQTSICLTLLDILFIDHKSRYPPNLKYSHNCNFNGSDRLQVTWFHTCGRPNSHRWQHVAGTDLQSARLVPDSTSVHPEGNYKETGRPRPQAEGSHKETGRSRPQAEGSHKETGRPRPQAEGSHKETGRPRPQAEGSHKETGRPQSQAKGILVQGINASEVKMV